MCTRCGICVDECPVGAISLEDDGAVINDAECIRCGKCHDVCPQEAVRHDGERLPQEVEANIQWARHLMGHFDSDAERAALLERLKRHFKLKRKILEETERRLQSLFAGEGSSAEASVAEGDAGSHRNALADS